MFVKLATQLPTVKYNHIHSKQSSHSLLQNYQQFGVVPHSCLEKADVRTRKNHSQKFRHIGYNIDPYGYGQSFFPNCISAWNGLAKVLKTLQRPTL